MIHRLMHVNAEAVALQNAAAARRSQSSESQAKPFNLSEILGADWNGTSGSAKTSSAVKTTTAAALNDSIASATASLVSGESESRQPVSTPTPASTTGGTAPTTAGTTGTTAGTTTTSPTTTSTPETTASATASTTAAATTPASTTTPTPGVGALVTAIMNGSFKPTYVTSQSQLQETTPAGTDTMPSFYYASSQTAQQLASLLGGTVVQAQPFGQDRGWSEPDANFIQLPNGQTFNAADVAYYANSASEGPAQLTADLTATINQGSAWTNYYQKGGSIPTFPMGYVGPPIAGMTYPAGMIGADGNVINPAMSQATFATS